jgi:hypothetical protein
MGAEGRLWEDMARLFQRFYRFGWAQHFNRFVLESSVERVQSWIWLQRQR